eukprot:CAMPEP_0113487416 /NCGR_PEP_ID=MMETSP0014_2-20120614/25498_1 /TAXON_ID=2857 /ORGANISM="Nitzschia sp." /LENGTH=319 /DNA_ID=CAMNT_0000381113 /DNA_START=177 /DNA_END=1136 /DNA_ORIENTATION=- /assembly_acc=CAM_ASM_000159
MQQHQHQPQLQQPHIAAVQPAGRVYETKLMYIVQRCWHSGPQQYQPLDYRRLFHTQREAEEAAYHSAHAWMKAKNHGSGGGTAAIKTLLLPSYPSHNPQGSSYGFIAKGTLFWVRACVATIVVTDSSSSSNGGVVPRTGTSPGLAPAICHTQAYAILTEGVIGVGTGNRNSRRGTEISEGRVFGGDASAHGLVVGEARRIQNEFLQDQCPGTAPVSVTIATLSVGKPTEYSSEQFLADWPREVLQAPVSMMDDDGILNQQAQKRAMILDSSSIGPWNTINNERTEQYDGLDEGIVVDCPFEMPDSKRRRISPIGQSNIN